MKVICIIEPRKLIDAYDNLIASGVIPPIRVGNKYNVAFKVKFTHGVYYCLEEFERDLFHSELFAKLSDIDETELINEREEVYAG